MTQAHWAREHTKAEIYANIEYCCRFAKIQSGWNAKGCEACQMGKHAKHAFPCNVDVGNRALEVIHPDIGHPKQLLLVDATIM